HVDRIHIADNEGIANSINTHAIMADFFSGVNFPNIEIINNKFTVGTNARMLLSTSGGLSVPNAGTNVIIRSNYCSQIITGFSTWCGLSTVIIEDNDCAVLQNNQ